MKPQAAEKTDKSAPKVFDVAHPGKGKPSATSRPVIITNRPIIQDPMVSSSDSSEGASNDFKPKPAAVRLTIKPLTEPDKPAESEKTSKKEKTIAELAVEKAAEKAVEAVEKPQKEPAPETPADEAAADGQTDEEAAAPETTDASEAKDDESAAETDSNPEGSKSDSTDSDAPADETIPVDGTNKDAKEVAALEAIAKKQEEINGLVESREYFLPINAVERHRSKVVSIFGVVLILALGLLLVDLLLDVGFIHIPGVHPLTHFFTA